MVREEEICMSPSDIPSSPVDTSGFAFVVGIDIGSQTCDFCVLKPDKSQVEGISYLVPAPRSGDLRLAPAAHTCLMGARGRVNQKVEPCPGALSTPTCP